MENRYILNLDIKTNLTKNLIFKQGDNNTSILEVHVIDRGLQVDLTNYNIEFRFSKADGTVVFQDASTGVNIINATSGIVVCTLLSNTLAVVGDVRCEIAFKKNTDLLTTRVFTFKVEESIGQVNILSSTYISSIESKLDLWSQEYADMKAQVESVLTTNVQDEVITARTDTINNYPYTNLGARLDSMATKINYVTLCAQNRGVDLQAAGCILNDATKATANSQIIQNLITQGKRILFNPGVIYIDSSISLPQTFSGGRICGLGWLYSKFIMVTDNTPILTTQTYNTYGVVLEAIALEYKNQQWPSTHPNSAAVYFYTATDLSYGFYHWLFKEVRINQACYGFRLCDTSNTVVWGCAFKDIMMYNISQNAIYFNALKGQLGNQFDNLKVLNYSIKDTTNHSFGKCIVIKGEVQFNNLDIEDWYGELYQNDDGYTSFKNVHIERNHLYDTSLYHRLFLITGNCYVENFNYISAVYPSSITKFVRIFDVSTAYSSLCVNQAYVTNANLSNILTFIYTINNPKVDLKGINMQAFTNIYSTAVNPEILTNTNLVLDGKPFRELFRFATKPTNIDYKLGDFYYSSNLQSGQPLGWIATCNAYVNPNPSTLTSMYASVTNSNTLSVSGNSAVEGLKVGDKIILAGVTTEIYTVQSVNSASSVTTVETVPHTYSSVTIKYANPITASTTAGNQTITTSGYTKGIFKTNDGIVLNALTSEVFTITAITPFSITVLEPMTHTYSNVQIDVVSSTNDKISKGFNILT